ncbi:MAG: hypothetical protein Q4G49_01000 [Paracoccus sp. (in: a-proteobacteria)]|nr:hypothetical protein [Paracoccus sp. (in: a-proteobacteria)]
MAKFIFHRRASATSSDKRGPPRLVVDPYESLHEPNLLAATKSACFDPPPFLSEISLKNAINQKTSCLFIRDEIRPNSNHSMTRAAR